MLYQFIKSLFGDRRSAEPQAPVAEQLTHWEPIDRTASDASRGLTPAKLDSIFVAANGGDPRSQARMAMELEEKDWDAAHALETRRAAVRGAGWSVKPSRGREEDPAAKAIAEAAEAMLGDLDSLPDLLEHCLRGILPGYAVAEILWEGSGTGIEGFNFIAPNVIGFKDSMEPLICTQTSPMGEPLVANKFVVHRHQARSGDLTRGGLIRPLGWMFCFSQAGIKDLLRFSEKFGMPFVSARIDENAWKNDRLKIAQLIRNFGSDGGGVFSKGVEIEFLQAAQTGGDLYFKMLEYFQAAKTRVILGQTATSGDAQGFSNGGAQAAVRQDILESDAAQVAATIRQSILKPWTAWNYGPAAPVPVFEFDVAQKADVKALSEQVERLGRAGYDMDEAELTAAFGMTITRRTAAAPANDLGLADSPRRRPVELATESVVAAALDELKTGDALADWLGPVAAALQEALDGDETDEQAFRSRLAGLLQGLPGLMDDMDTKGLEDILARAMYSADANGRLAAAAAAKKAGRARA
jgi:phage gp29-like protein